MAAISFQNLPGEARVWVFAASDALVGDKADALLGAADEFLGGWKAHDLPLTCARDWREDRFLAIGVDQRDAHASGCSIDGLFRVLQRLESSLGTSLVGGGRVFYRDGDGRITCVSRAEFAARAAAGSVADNTRVLDTTVTTASAYRDRFEQPAAASWHAALFPTNRQR
ncbi:MAG TPA: hypothetical protein VH762_18900 [Gemmatimonadaceae bacterium]|jgi:hypothetical protein